VLKNYAAINNSNGKRLDKGGGVLFYSGDQLAHKYHPALRAPLLKQEGNLAARKYLFVLL
jgi:hypothetical protein